jgi:hypothetical protein
MRDNNQINVINTCPIDYYLFALWELSQIVSELLEKLTQLDQTVTIKTIINNIEIKNWNLARQNGYTLIMKKDLNTNHKINFFGEVEVFFLKYIYAYQTHSLLQKCKTNCIYNGNLIISDNSAILAYRLIIQFV